MQATTTYDCDQWTIQIMHIFMWICRWFAIVSLDIVNELLISFRFICICVTVWFRFVFISLIFMRLVSFRSSLRKKKEAKETVCELNIVGGIHRQNVEFDFAICVNNFFLLFLSLCNLILLLQFGLQRRSPLLIMCIAYSISSTLTILVLRFLLQFARFSVFALQWSLSLALESSSVVFVSFHFSIEMHGFDLFVIAFFFVFRWYCIRSSVAFNLLPLLL